MQHKHIKCPQCGNFTQADFPYCNHCGAKLDLDNIAIEAEEIEEKAIQPPTHNYDTETPFYVENSVPQQFSNTQSNATTQKSLKDRFIEFYKKYPKRVIIVGIALVIAVIAVIIIPIIVSTAGDKGEKLDEREQAIYQLVLDASYKFKNPSSVRVISGQATYRKIDEDNLNEGDSAFDLKRGYYIGAYFRLSATNGFGATTTDYYFCGYNSDDGKLFVYDFDTYKELVPTLYDKMVEWADKTDDFNIDKINSMLDKKWSN